MKKVILLLAISIISVSAMAQKVKKEVKPKKFTWGVQGGLNVSGVTGNDVEGVKAKVGSVAGFHFNHKLKRKNFSLQYEANYTMLGYKFKGGENDEVRLDYIAVPVMIKYQNAKSGFGAYTGPQIAKLTSAKSDIDGIKENINNTFSKFDFQWVGGISYDIPKSRIAVHARYQWGLARILKDNESDVFNTAATFLLAYKF